MGFISGTSTRTKSNPQGTLAIIKFYKDESDVSKNVHKQITRIITQPRNYPG